ncbi:MAG: Y-family DNA polymerase [Cyanobacteria bacterium J06559_3]
MSSAKRSSQPPRRIGLVDCNNFYASCERAFNPQWANVPLGVLSNNDGCIVARSSELKQAGIPMGAPYFKWRDQLAAMGAVVVSSNYALYGDMSHRVMSVLGEFTPELEVYSIDEAWLDLTGFDPAELDAYGREVVSKTQQYTGIPVSMGMAPTKVLAKLANRICKQRRIPGQVFNLGSADALDEVLAMVPVEDIWGIGRRWAKRLKQQHIQTAKELKEADPSALRQRYNVVMERIVLELRGIPCLEFEDIAPRQTIQVSRSFGVKVTAKKDLLEAAATYASRAAVKLRQQHSVCAALQVSIRSSRFHPSEPQCAAATTIAFPVPTADTRPLIAAATTGIEQIYQPGIRYAKAGIMLLDISPAATTQQHLFAVGDSEKSARLMATLDQLNQTLGAKTLFFAREGMQQPWSMKRDNVTPAYTTRWSDIPVVS